MHRMWNSVAGSCSPIRIVWAVPFSYLSTVAVTKFSNNYDPNAQPANRNPKKK